MPLLKLKKIHEKICVWEWSPPHLPGHPLMGNQTQRMNWVYTCCDLLYQFISQIKFQLKTSDRIYQHICNEYILPKETFPCTVWESFFGLYVFIIVSYLPNSIHQYWRHILKWHKALTLTVWLLSANHICKGNLIIGLIQWFKGPTYRGKSDTDMHFGMQRKADWNLW